MKRWIFGLLIFCVGAPAFSQNKDDVQTFELTPSAPSTQYWLLCDPRLQLPGNAAPLYADAEAMLNDAATKRIDVAKDAYDGGKDSFASLAAEVFDAHGQSILSLLDIAARRDHCDWSSAARDLGFNTPLPLEGDIYLGEMIQVRVFQEIRSGQFDTAVNSLRLGYEFGLKEGNGGLYIADLIGVGVLGRACDATAELMKQPRAPNLYRALASLPHPILNLQHSFTFELAGLQNSFHELSEDRLQGLSSEDWRRIYKQVVTINALPNTPAQSNDQTLADEVARTLPQARDYYERTYKLSVQQAEGFDAFKVVATYWYAQEQAQAELQYRLAALPYPILLEKASELDKYTAQMISEQPTNVFLETLDTKFYEAAFIWARLDRKLAALTDVEAIRSYAAANSGKLPGRLEDISDTPALDNPCTGKPFSYSVQGETATLSDPQPSNHPITYTIRIRK